MQYMGEDLAALEQSLRTTISPQLVENRVTFFKGKNYTDAVLALNGALDTLSKSALLVNRADKERFRPILNAMETVLAGFLKGQGFESMADFSAKKANDSKTVGAYFSKTWGHIEDMFNPIDTTSWTASMYEDAASKGATVKEYGQALSQGYVPPGTPVATVKKSAVPTLAIVAGLAAAYFAFKG